MPLFANLAYQSGATPASILFLRFTMAAVFMILWAFLRKIPFPRGQTLLLLMVIGAVGYAGMALSYFTALTLAPAGMVAILLYLYPVIVVVVSIVFLRHPIMKLDVIALVLALAGTALVIGMDLGGKPLGIVLGIVAAILYALYVIVGTKVTRNTNAFTSTAVMIASASLAFGGLVSLQGFHFPTTAAGWWAVIALAIISTVVAIGTFWAGLKRIGPIKACMFSTLEPVVTVMLSVMFLGEVLTIPKIIGGVMVMITAVLLTRNELSN
jgi:drug/metabolite transporter (DMT)-like permease